MPCASRVPIRSRKSLCRASFEHVAPSTCSVDTCGSESTATSAQLDRSRSLGSFPLSPGDVLAVANHRPALLSFGAHRPSWCLRRGPPVHARELSILSRCACIAAFTTFLEPPPTSPSTSATCAELHALLSGLAYLQTSLSKALGMPSGVSRPLACL